MSTIYLSPYSIERVADSRQGPDEEAMNIIDGTQPLLHEDVSSMVVRLAIALASMPPRLRRAALYVISDPRAPRALVAHQAGVSKRTLCRAIQRLLSLSDIPPAIGSSPSNGLPPLLRRGTEDGVTYAGKERETSRKARKTSRRDACTHDAEGSES